MLKVEIPNSRIKIERQIEALEYLFSIDTREKDKQIHQQAITDLKKALSEFKEK